MNNDEFTQVVTEQLNYCQSLLIKKGDEYDRKTDDRLHTFKIAGALQGEKPMQALGGMMAKHTISIYDLIKENNLDENLWAEKITDHINYLLLLKALVKEENKNVL